MSTYANCSRAVRDLAKRPEPFTEIDVVLKAGHGKNWSKKILKDAMRQANAVVGQQYRASKLVRFGPVEFNGELDYARLASKIVYAGVEIKGGRNTPVVPEWKTPNGTFPALFVSTDTIGRTGRRSGNNRDDMQPWDDQEVVATGDEQDHEERAQGSGPEVENNPVKVLSDKLRTAEQTIELLRKELDTARAALTDQEQADESQVRQIVSEVVLDLIADLESATDTRFNSLEERLERLEATDEAHRRIYSLTAA